ncbi:nicotinamide riboside transporter PnuC [Natronospirillum operosum]|uniref:nicotinamide riboside transporter PnuC n=1 Tax=Natronospirillum operosum TaxID=2759953 RepID=UPI00197C3877|nr:nicotinamide riboside transporter PnuC [Natronospirillum operosum]
MSNLFSVEMILVTVLGYPLSYIEFFGTVLYLASVYLVAKRHVLTWPVGIVSVLLFMVLFYQIRLYSAAAEQMVYLAACTYGWWYWAQSGIQAGRVEGVGFSPVPTLLKWLGVIVVLSAALGLVMTRVHEWAPTLFPEAAAFPLIDAATTVTSLVAMWLMARKRTESWVLWIAVDVVSIWLYFVKGVAFVSLLYVVLLGLATLGLLAWLKAGRPSHRLTSEYVS